MSICPTPPLKRKTDYATVGSISLTAPQPKYEFCQGGTTAVITSPGDIITSTICCPSPGPAGPAGTAGPEGPAGTFTLKYDGVELGQITSLDVKGLGLLPEIIGTEASLSTTCMRWAGDWAAGTAYKKYDVVRNAANGNGYACMDDHTSAAEDIPEGDGGFYWEPITDLNKATLPPEELSFLDSLQNDILDWLKSPWTVQDWLIALAAGAGIIYAGSKILDMYNQDGTGDGQADSRYYGSPGYNGSYVPPTLPDIVSSLMEFGGYAPSQYDVSLLPTDQVHFTLSSTMTIRNVLQQLALVYQFDIVPSGGAVKFVPKYQASIRTLTSNDLGHQLSEDLVGKAPYTAKRMQGIDLPRSVTLTYYSAELDYNPFSQVSTLETFEEGQDVKLEVPFTLIDADAKRITETAMVNAHIEQQQYTFTTDYYNVDLEPGDIIDIPLDSGGTSAVRIVQITEADDGVLEFTTVRADNNNTTYNVSQIPQVLPPDQTTNVPTTLGYSQSLFLEVPPLNASETTPRVKVAVHGYGAAGWPGATLYKSTDGGATYTVVGQSSGTPTIGLVATATLSGTPDYHSWDTSSVITVQLKQGTLNNSTDIGVQNGANWCMVGEEVIGFVNATLVAADTYQLTRLMRGRAGSEVKVATHVNNELFVVLDNQLIDIPLTAAEIGQPVKYKTVTNGSDLSKVSADDVSPFGLNVRPWAVAQLKAVREVNDDWTITWIERVRFNNALQDYVEITHDADWAGYALAILDGATVKYVATTTSPSYTYTAAQQVTDFGSVQTTLQASVKQLSTTYGGGYPATVTV